MPPIFHLIISLCAFVYFFVSPVASQERYQNINVLINGGHDTIQITSPIERLNDDTYNFKASFDPASIQPFTIERVINRPITDIKSIQYQLTFSHLRLCDASQKNQICVIAKADVAIVINRYKVKNILPNLFLRRRLSLTGGFKCDTEWVDQIDAKFLITIRTENGKLLIGGVTLEKIDFGSLVEKAAKKFGWFFNDAIEIGKGAIISQLNGNLNAIGIQLDPTEYLYINSLSTSRDGGLLKFDASIRVLPNFNVIKEINIIGQENERINLGVGFDQRVSSELWKYVDVSKNTHRFIPMDNSRGFKFGLEDTVYLKVPELRNYIEKISTDIGLTSAFRRSIKLENIALSDAGDGRLGLDERSFVELITPENMKGWGGLESLSISGQNTESLTFALRGYAIPDAISKSLLGTYAGRVGLFKERNCDGSPR
jgi:hypothetical protein